jgi:two-component system, OmpR family, response regulator
MRFAVGMAALWQEWGFRVRKMPRYIAAAASGALCMKILIADDDHRLCELLRLALERAGYEVVAAADGQSAIALAAAEAPDLIVLDVGLPEMDGVEAYRHIRLGTDVPILFLIANDDEIDRVVGLELGADDFVTKPFSPREVLARVRTMLKRLAAPVDQPMLVQGRLVLDANSRRCQFAQTSIGLTTTEFQLLALLMANPRRFLSHRVLIAAMWGAKSMVSDRALDGHLRSLGDKLALAGAKGAILSVQGKGYQIGPCN